MHPFFPFSGSLRAGFLTCAYTHCARVAIFAVIGRLESKYGEHMSMSPGKRDLENR
jgi:hypothetical protein